MISTGIDLVEISRFQKLVNQETFQKNCFCEEELKYLQKIENNLRTMAGMYAAKEAFLKAIHKGIGDYSMREIMILHEESGAPKIALEGQIKKDIVYQDCSLSISHEKDFAVASVILLF